MLALMEMVVQGFSTRKMTKITEELCGTSFSKSTVSELCKAAITPFFLKIVYLNIKKGRIVEEQILFFQ